MSGGKRRTGGMAAPRPWRKRAAAAAARRGAARGRGPGGRPRRAGPRGRARTGPAAAVSGNGGASPAGGGAGWRGAGPGRAGAAGRASGSRAGKPPSPTGGGRGGPGRRGAGPGRVGTAGRTSGSRAGRPPSPMVGGRSPSSADGGTAKPALGRPPGVSVAQLREAAAAAARGVRPSAPAGGVDIGGAREGWVGVWEASAAASWVGSIVARRAERSKECFERDAKGYAK